jgi:hypothetical protein
MLIKFCHCIIVHCVSSITQLKKKKKKQANDDDKSTSLYFADILLKKDIYKI